MATLTVGTGSEFDFQTVSAAIAAAQAGDTIQVEAGTYTNDFGTINNSVTIEGVGGMVNLVATEPPPNLKAILTIGGVGEEPNVVLENISFSGAEISNDDGGNGAGIRYQSGTLTLDHTYFTNNQDGILADADSTGTITIENSSFVGNGNPNPPGSGIEHNIYIGAIAQLTIENSYFDNPIVGHDIKSRAANNFIEDNRIYDQTGSGSYEIDLPNGGNAVIENNVIEKGPNAGNSNFLSIGEEGAVNPTSTLMVSGNTIINNRGGGNFLINDTSTTADITNDTFYGLDSGQIVEGPGTQEGDSYAAISNAPSLDTSAPYLPVIPESFACFAAGTRIATPKGAIPIEALRVGQRVTVRHPHQDSAPIKWIGHRRIDLDRHNNRLGAAPIRIEADTFEDGAPSRDLLLSPDHAIYLDGRLIPIRLLLNDGSIRRETKLRSIQYFHIELENHGILIADGLEVESYLDTGNRDIFENAPDATTLHPDLSTLIGQSARESFSCAPFETRPSEVEPIWWRTAFRAAALGHSIPEPNTTKDPNLRLWTGNDWILPDAASISSVHFTLPHGVHSPFLVSRATAPCDVNPWLEDQRPLGIAISSIHIETSAGEIDLPADDPSLHEGWWPSESNAQNVWRWTAGHARLPTPEDVVSIEITLAGETPYLLDQDRSLSTMRSVA